MIENALDELLSESAQTALETMFFAFPDTVSNDPQRPTGELIAASLKFRGAREGRFGLLISDAAARTLAANFLGVDDAAGLVPAQVSGVVEELANMVCGAVLSELQPNATLNLGAPESTQVSADESGPDFTGGSPSTCRLEFAEGTLVLFLRFEECA